MKFRYFLCNEAVSLLTLKEELQRPTLIKSLVEYLAMPHKIHPNFSQLFTKCRFQESEVVVIDLEGFDPIGVTISEIMYI